MSATYIIAKRNYRGTLLGYLTTSRAFDTQNAADTLTFESQGEANQAAQDWTAFWASKGLLGLAATVETLKPETAQ